MKIFHMSDLHIGIKLYNYDLREEQRYVLEQVIQEVKKSQPDAFVIAGDIYDKSVPSADAVQFFDWFLQELYQAAGNMEIFVISGNHDSAGRLDCFRWILEKQHIHMAGFAPRTPEEFMEKVTLQDAYGEVDFYMLPFVKPSMLRGFFDVEERDQPLSYDQALHDIIEREQIDTTRRNVFISHQFYLPSGTSAESIERAESEVQTVGNIDAVRAEVLQGFDYAALGHIHKPMKAGDARYRYCGTPMAYSLSEAGQEKGILSVELREKGEEPVIETIPLKPLRQIRCIKGMFEEVVKQPSEDYVSILLTDQEDLETIDMQERLRRAFPHLLEIRREHVQAVDFDREISDAETADPFALLCEFLPDMDQEEQNIMQEIFNEAKEMG